MKDNIEEILRNANLSEDIDVSELTSKITKEVALHTVPKSTYNELNQKYKNEQATNTSISEELEGYKATAKTVPQKENELAEALKSNKELARTVNRLQAKEILREANISNEKIDELLEQIVVEDTDKTLQLAQSFASVLKKEIDDTKKSTEEKLLKNTPKPNVKTPEEGDKSITKEDFLKMTYSEKKELFKTNKDLYDKFTSE
jgi:hypothetical protein